MNGKLSADSGDGHITYDQLMQSYRDNYPAALDEFIKVLEAHYKEVSDAIGRLNGTSDSAIKLLTDVDNLEEYGGMP